MMIFTQKGGIYMKMKNFKKLAVTLAVVITCQSIPAYTVLADDAAEGNTKNSVMTTSGNDVAGTTTLENNEEVTKSVVESEENVADTTSGNDPGIMLLSFDDCTHGNGVITPNNDGTHHVSCPDCSYNEDVDCNYGTPVSNDDGTHHVICADCAYETDITCTYENGTCTECSAEDSEYAPLDCMVDKLDDGSVRVTVEATDGGYFPNVSFGSNGAGGELNGTITTEISEANKKVFLITPNEGCTVYSFQYCDDNREQKTIILNDVQGTFTIDWKKDSQYLNISVEFRYTNYIVSVGSQIESDYLDERGYIQGIGNITIDNPNPVFGDIVTITFTPEPFAQAVYLVTDKGAMTGFSYIHNTIEQTGEYDLLGNSIIACDYPGYASFDPVTIKIKINYPYNKELKINAYYSKCPIIDLKQNIDHTTVTLTKKEGYSNGDKTTQTLVSFTVTGEDGYTPVGYKWRLHDTEDWHFVYLTNNYKSSYNYNFNTSYTDGLEKSDLFNEDGSYNNTAIVVEPLVAMLHLNTVGMVKAYNLSPNIFTNRWDLSDSYSQNMLKTGLYFDDNFVYTADNAEGKKVQRFADMFSARNWRIGTLDDKYKVDGAYYTNCNGSENRNMPYVQIGDTLALYSTYGKADFAKYGISYVGNGISNMQIGGLSPRSAAGNYDEFLSNDDFLSYGGGFDGKMEDSKSEYRSYFAGKYYFPQMNPGSVSDTTRVDFTPVFIADTYNIIKKDGLHGTYTAVNTIPERYQYNGLGTTDPETGEWYSYSSHPTEASPNHLYEGDDIGFIKSTDDTIDYYYAKTKLSDNEFTYMDTITCTATPNTGWHVKEWVCMQDGENRWAGMFDDETADYSTFTINMTNLGDAKIYPVFEGADSVVPTTEPTATPDLTATPTVAPTVEPTVAPTEAPTATETPAPEEDDDDEPEPTVEPTATPEPTEVPKAAVIPVTPTKPEDTPEPTATPTVAPTSAPEKTAEPEIVIVPPAEPVELEDNISKIIPATLAVTGTGAFGFSILFLVMRRKRKFHGIFAEELIPGTKEMGDRTEKSYDYFVPELIQKVNAGSIGVSRYEDVLLGSDVITLFPADTKVTVTAEGLSVTFAADEAKLFDYLLKIKGQALVMIDSEEKNIHLTFTYNL